MCTLIAFKGCYGGRKMVFVLALIAVGCGQGSNQVDTLFERIPAAHSGIRFANQIEETKRLNAITYELIYNGAGVGVGDVNNDGRPDLFFASNMGVSRLYLNEGDFQFRDVTEASGIQTRGKWASGVAMVDINHDGHLDIYISCGGPFADPQRRANELYINKGDGTFTERAEAYGLADTGHTTQTAFFDYDRDGDLDAYLLTNGIGEVSPNVIRPKKMKGEAINTDRLYRNDGEGAFTDVSASAGIQMEGYGLGVAVFDANRDGWPDVYVANDYLPNDLLYINNRDGTFTDRAGDFFRHQSYAAMGTDVADINNDGLMDVMTLDMLPESNERLMQMYETAGYERNRSELQHGYDPQVGYNTLQLNRGLAPDGQPVFSEIAQLAGVHATDWSWSPLIADFDNDGWRDLFVTNGIPRDVTNRDFSNYKMRLLTRGGHTQRTLQGLVKGAQKLEEVRVHNYLFENNGDLTFSDQSQAWGMHNPSFSTGAAYVDLDNDGDLDLVTNNVNDQAFVYRNHADQQGRHYLSVDLDGPPQNPAGLGAQVAVYYGKGQSQHHHHTVYRGYKSTVASTVHFGLGRATTVDSVVVTWPDAHVQAIGSLAVNQVVTVAYDQATHTEVSSETTRGPSAAMSRLFADVTSERSLGFKHQEQHYNDFKIQPLLPRKYSQGGPGMAVGDVNGDGRDDFYVGGAFEQAGQLYLQNEDGTFESRDLTSGNNYEEDMGALFFDANGDGHLDLYVASGGSEFRAGSKYYQDRLYLGNGSGAFQHASDALPPMRTSSSAVVAGDYDRDGDLDLFVGGRVVPNQYPTAPRSYLLENRGGTFVDVTEQKAPGLEKPGLVTDALWTDFNDDGRRDLIIVGEWMPFTVFENRDERFVNVTADLGLAQTVGWWNSLTAGDFDRDGDTDYVAGNLGLNTRLKNKPKGAVRMLVNDFNGDGRTDAVMSRMVEDARVPLHFRDDVVAQMPMMADRFPSYASYAQAKMRDLFTEQERKKAVTYESDTFKTSYIENQDGQAFAVRALPARTQFAPMFGITSGDYNGDGKRDLLMVGNSYATEAFTQQYDAFNGALLHGNGRGDFTRIPMSESGFYVEGDGKAMAELLTSTEQLILVARNNDSLKAFSSARSNRSNLRYLPVRSSETRAEVTYKDGSVEKVEFYYGSGYLSQSSRALVVADSVEKVTVYTARGENRTWTP